MLGEIYKTSIALQSADIYGIEAINKQRYHEFPQNPPTFRTEKPFAVLIATATQIAEKCDVVVEFYAPTTK